MRHDHPSCVFGPFNWHNLAFDPFKLSPPAGQCAMRESLCGVAACQSGGYATRAPRETNVHHENVVAAVIEEEIFYSAGREAGVDAAILDEAEIEHALAKELIAQIGASNSLDGLYDARVKVLGEYIRHHVKEEEDEIFPACRNSDMDLEEVGARLDEKKTELMRKLNGN